MSGKKILVADDSLTIQKVIRLALSHEGYDIQTVSEGNEAIEQILLTRPGLVLIDVTLPGKSATEVKAAISEKPELASIPFVLMSSAFETVDEKAIESAGFAGRLTKPFDPAHLRKLVAESLGAGQTPGELTNLSLVPPPFAGRGPVPPPPVPSFRAPQSDDSDIRELTQSTLKMAGFEDLDWSVNETARKDQHRDQHRDQKDHHEPSYTGIELAPDLSSPGLPPLPPLPHEAPLSAPSAAASAYYQPPIEPESGNIAGLQGLEGVVRQQVEEAVLKATRELLPQIAERVIKAEINRLLNEVP